MIDLEKVLVIGGSGMVGSAIPFGYRPPRAELDITDSDSVERAFNLYQPEAVIHLAGLIDIHECENNPDRAHEVNVGGAITVARCATASGLPLVYFSSGMIFDGTKDGPYDESDTPCPINVYGDTKYRGEQEVLSISTEALVVRTGWLFGGVERDTKFIHRFFNMLGSGQAIRAADDRYGSPAYTVDLVDKTLNLLRDGERGIAHVVNEGVVSYFDVAIRMKENLAARSPVEGVPFSELAGIGAVKRGRMEGLVSNRGISLRSYEDALADYVTLLEGA